MLVVEFSGKSAVYRACATARFLPAADGRKCPERVVQPTLGWLPQTGGKPTFAGTCSGDKVAPKKGHSRDRQQLS
jgi:hypothetical protein